MANKTPFTTYRTGKKGVKSKKGKSFRHAKVACHKCGYEFVPKNLRQRACLYCEASTDRSNRSRKKSYEYPL